MTSTAVVALPASGDRSTWSEQEAALVEAAGLTRVVNKTTGEKALADRPTVEAFLQHCRRTGLDPIARQIYAIYRGGKWGIQISIDGARLVAERSKQYEGQTPTEWTADGVTWTQVWLSSEPPAAARVGVYRTGFREALYAVATWDSYAVMEDEWEGPSGSRRKTGRQVVSSMWQKFGPLMLGKCAEMLALRKAFPQDLSGLYSTEEMAQANPPAVAPAPVNELPGEDKYGPAGAVDEPAAVPAEPFATENWAARIVDATTVEDLRQVHVDASVAGELGMFMDPKFQTHIDGMVSLFGLSAPDGPVRVGVAIAAVKPVLEKLAAEETVVGEVVEDDAAPTEVSEWPTAEPGSGGPAEDPGGVRFQ